MAKGEKGPSERICGTMPVHERLLRTDPGYLEARVRSENAAFEARTMRAMTARAGITVIPVVVHVVHKTNAQNISEAQIRSQIDVLNRDFRKTNPDIANVPAPFVPLAADARIEFELATTDPSGAATDGITRTKTTANSFSDDESVKAASSGGADAWPRDDYLNIWVCELNTNGLLGYAQFPGGPAATDGVVILHTAFGTTGTAAAPFNLGRTATHEIGHFLNLRHIWGDDGTGCSGDDFVADTPNAAGPNRGAPAFPRVTCSNGPNGDMFMNYMDYTDDVAMFMFTDGQVTRMQTCLDNDRPSLGHVKPGPKLKVADDPITLKLADDPATFKVRDDIGTLKVSDDPATLKFRDDIGTLKVSDDPATLKFRDDIGTLKVSDDPATLKFRDDIGTLKVSDDPGTLKVVDDGPGTLKFGDDGPGTLKFGDDGPGTPPQADLGGPQGPPGGGDPAPFILSTPHHSRAWISSYPGALEARLGGYETQIAEYEQLLEQCAQADEAGQLGEQDRAAAEQLYNDYTRLVEEYRQLRGG
jgi:pregnancy-associated plasma protein-A